MPAVITYHNGTLKRFKYLCCQNKYNIFFNINKYIYKQIYVYDILKIVANCLLTYFYLKCSQISKSAEAVGVTTTIRVIYMTSIFRLKVISHLFILRL